MAEASIESVVDKALKLLNLASNNPNEAESQSAFLKCQELLARHNLDMSVLQGAVKIEVEAGEDAVIVQTKRVDWLEQLVWVITENFRCHWYIHRERKEIYQEKYNNTYKQEFTHYIIYGLALDREMCAAVLKSAQYAIEILSKAAGAKGAVEKRNYALGFVHGLREKFSAQRRMMESSMALMLVTPEETKTYGQKLNLGQAEALSVKYSYGDSYQSGRIDGKAFETNVVGGGSGRGHLTIAK